MTVPNLAVSDNPAVFIEQLEEEGLLACFMHASGSLSDEEFDAIARWHSESYVKARRMLESQRS